MKIYATFCCSFYSFGNSQIDELSTLEPLRQCCLIRATTLQKLLHFKNSDTSLAEAVRTSLNLDPLASKKVPQKHLTSLDRRLDIIISLVNDCVQTKGLHEVVRGGDLKADASAF